MLMICRDTVSDYRILLQADTNVYYNQMWLDMEKTWKSYFCPLSYDDLNSYSNSTEKLVELN